MSHRYSIAAVFLAALAVPAAAQQTTTQPSATQPSTTQTDTSKKSTTGTTTSTSNGSIAEPTTPSTAPAPMTTPATGVTSTPTTITPSVSAPSTTPSSTDASTSAAASAAPGQVQPTSGVAKVEIKVAPSLANSVKISADSALALSRTSFPGYEVSSAELEMKDKRLVYNVKMVKGTAASTVHVDGMTGEVVKDKKFGGLKAAVENQKETQKLYDAKKDSAATKNP